MRKRIAFCLAACVVLCGSPAWSMEFQYSGATEKLQQAREWCSGEAQKIISSGAVDGKFTNALFNGLMLEKLRPDADFKGTRFNDVEINEITEFTDFLWKQPSDLLKPLQHPFLGSRLASFKVHAVQQRAKELFGNDGPEHWRIPKEKEDPKRLYALARD